MASKYKTRDQLLTILASLKKSAPNRHTRRARASCLRKLNRRDAKKEKVGFVPVAFVQGGP